MCLSCVVIRTSTQDDIKADLYRLALAILTHFKLSN